VAAANTPAQASKIDSPPDELPGPRSIWPLAPLFAFRRDPIAFLRENARVYGDLVHFRLGPRHAYQLNHPDLVRDLLITESMNHHRGPLMQRARSVLGEGLLTAEEPLHGKQRRVIQPAFHRERILEYAGPMLECAGELSRSWQDGGTVDIHEAMSRLTLAIVGKSLFGAGFEQDAERITSAATELMAVVKLIFWPFSRMLMELPLPSMVRFRRACRDLDRVIRRLIEERRSGTTSRNDLLSALLEARGAGETSEETVRQVRDECLTLVLAGHETVANALTYSFVLLARHPDVASRMREEIEGVAGNDEIAGKHFEKLAFTRAVFAESMRLYPPAWVLARTAKVAYTIHGHIIRKGSILFASQYVLHRDPRFFADTEQFCPERFLNPVHPRFAYFPFGAGPRQCIGEGFAWMEGVLVLASLWCSWDCELLQEGLALDPSVTLRPGSAVRVRLRRVRKNRVIG
jgi:cytochrome P450